MAAPAAAKRRTALVLLAIMVGMAATGLAFALYTAGLRQERHPRPREVPPPLTIAQPADLPALGFVPAGASVVCGVQVAALLETPAGKGVLDTPVPGIFAKVFEVFQAAGIRLDDVDHVAAALVDRPVMPALALIVRTRAPYDLEKLADAVQPAQASLRAKRPLYEFALPPAGEAAIWGADERTIVVILSPFRRDEPARADLPADLLAGVPDTPLPIEQSLTPALRATIRARLDRRSLLWIAGDMEKSPLASKIAWMRLSWQHWFPTDAVKRFVVGVYPGEGVTLLGSFFAGTPAAAAKLTKSLQDGKPPEGASLKVEGPPPGMMEPEAQWVTLQLRMEPTGLRELLSATGRKR